MIRIQLGQPLPAVVNSTPELQQCWLSNTGAEEWRAVPLVYDQRAESD